MKQINNQILVVDDNDDILLMLKTMLQLKGYDVIVKDSAEGIENFIEKVMPEIILMDMLLSGKDGREICKKLKTTYATKDIPIIMISALPEAELMCLAEGADFFIAKPFDMTDLFQVIAKAMGKRKLV